MRATLLHGKTRQVGILMLLLPGANIVTVDRGQSVLERVPRRLQDDAPHVVSLVGGEAGAFLDAPLRVANSRDGLDDLLLEVLAALALVVGRDSDSSSLLFQAALLHELGAPV